MYRQAITALVFLIVLSTPGGGAWAQRAIDIARLNQDIAFLTEQLGKLTLRVDVLERENEQLRKASQAQRKSQLELSEALESQSASVGARFSTLSDRDQVLKAEIITGLTSQIHQLTAETQKAINTLAKGQSLSSASSNQLTFDKDYPQTGIPYEVKPGDTLSGIARQFQSTVRDIQNANQIANPNKDLKVGATIFVPQSNPH